ncbi:MAG: dihydrolipoyl dehydrogenase [Candidatus Diapherotrites archaeon]|uniref:Dihydrolipoyl dehydrogenase n=1 Tax=Candidatus Iainarchaeum sp. TaxID=3101447 RepID=A0A8T4L5B3_9ARCH|nr:dihydrolipoyl dehydrogenase [Candidatus Diapherotrites archaeon]
MVMGESLEETDCVVIGGGPGGYVAAIRLGQLGKQVMLIDRDGLGGVCLHTGCIPSKALIKAANQYWECRKPNAMGINVGSVSLDLKKMAAWKNDSISRLEKGIANLCKKYNVEVVKGTAFFEASDRILVSQEHGTRRVSFRNAIIATGSKVSNLPGLEHVQEFVWTAEDALELTELPKDLVIVGGGYIAAEMVNVYAKFGCNVSIVERSAHFLEHLDRDAAEVVLRGIESMGVQVFLSTEIQNAKKSGKKVLLELKSDEKSFSISADKVLVAIGRVANSKHLGLEHTQVQLDERGFVRVNSQCKSTDPKIFAVGDCTGGPMLAHRAFRMGKVAAEAVCGESSAFDNTAMPSVVFADPEIAVTGISEGQALAKGLDVVIGKFPFHALGRAVSSDATDGFVKVIADRKTKVILGVVMVGEHVSEFLSEATLAVETACQLEDVASTIHPHPTFSESLAEACEQALGKAIHVPNKK